MSATNFSSWDLDLRGSDTNLKGIFHPEAGVKAEIKRRLNKAERCHCRSRGLAATIREFDIAPVSASTETSAPASQPLKFWVMPEDMADAPVLANFWDDPQDGLWGEPEPEFEPEPMHVPMPDEVFESLGLPDWAVGVNFEEVKTYNRRGRGPDADEEIDE